LGCFFFTGIAGKFNSAVGKAVSAAPSRCAGRERGSRPLRSQAARLSLRFAPLKRPVTRAQGHPARCSLAGRATPLPTRHASQHRARRSAPSSCADEKREENHSHRRNQTKCKQTHKAPAEPSGKRPGMFREGFR